MSTDDLRAAIQLVAEVNEIEVGGVGEPDMSWFTELVAAGGSLDKQQATDKKETPLIRAVRGNSPAGVVKVLLDAGASVHATDWFNNTPLHHAAFYLEAACVEHLLRAGAEVDALNNFQQTPLNDMCAQHELSPNVWDLSSPRFVEIARLLIEAGTDLGSKDQNDYTPLHNVCARNGFALAQVLIEAGANINFANRDGYTPLHAACDRKKADTITVLLESGADPNLRDNYGMSALHGAAETGERSIVTYLLNAGADPALVINGSGWKWSRPGMIAAEVAFAHSHVELALQLAKAVPQDPGMCTAAIVLAECYGDDPREIRESGLAQYIVSKGSLERRAEAFGFTPLIVAARRGALEAVRALIDAGADIHGTDPVNQTALHHAAVVGEVRIVEELLRLGATVDAVDNAGATALTRVCQRAEAKLYAEGARPSLYMDQNLSMWRLVEAGANVDHQNHQGKSPLHHASASGHRGLVSDLIKCGATINLPDTTGATPLHAACENTSYDAVRVLLKNGADPNIRDNFGTTALHLAAAAGAQGPVNQLLKAGADPTLVITGRGWDKAQPGMTPAAVATAYGRTKLAATLDAAGA